MVSTRLMYMKLFLGGVFVSTLWTVAVSIMNIDKNSIRFGPRSILYNVSLPRIVYQASKLCPSSHLTYIRGSLAEWCNITENNVILDCSEYQNLMISGRRLLTNETYVYQINGLLTNIPSSTYKNIFIDSTSGILLSLIHI